MYADDFGRLCRAARPSIALGDFHYFAASISAAVEKTKASKCHTREVLRVLKARTKLHSVEKIGELVGLT